MSEQITSHRYVQGEDDCEECGEPIWRHWYTQRRDAPDEMAILEAIFDGDDD